MLSISMLSIIIEKYLRKTKPNLDAFRKFKGTIKT